MSAEDSKFKKPEEYSDLTNAQLEAEVAAIDLEMKKLSLVKMRDDVAKIKAQAQNDYEAANAKRIATLQFLASRKANQDRCNHRKGGRGPEAVMKGQGDDGSYAIIKHRLPSREFMALCQRCGKEWMPANKWNIEGGQIKVIPATEGWDWAINVPTDNSPSASSDFNFQYEKVG